MVLGAATEVPVKKHTPPRDNLKHVDYFSIFVSFAKMISPTIIERWGPEYIQSTLKNLFTSYRAATIIPELFRELSKERAIELYDFMLQYREYINVDDQTILEVRDIIREKMSDDHLVILNPSLEQMWGDELYRHEFMGNEYLIPLWWPEVTFQKEAHSRPHNGGDLRVKMIPDLPPPSSSTAVTTYTSPNNTTWPPCDTSSTTPANSTSPSSHTPIEFQK